MKSKEFGVVKPLRATSRHPVVHKSDQQMAKHRPTAGVQPLPCCPTRSLQQLANTLCQLGVVRSTRRMLRRMNQVRF
jgi:hypothetical protein